MGLILNICFILFLFNVFEKGNVSEDFHLQKTYHQPSHLTRNDIIKISQLSDRTRFNTILSNILIPRVPGSDTHKKVKNFIINKLKGLNWEVETQDSQQQTPLGPLPFSNIIARLNPSATRFLVLSCHYDSKHMREGAFMGATDSAVPCAMMVDLAQTLATDLESFRNSELSLMLLFFDGEEAFVEWGPNDSIYGSRSLAAAWNTVKYPLRSSTTNHIDRIDLLVLLDLLGAPHPTFYSYFRNTQKWYLQLASAEKRLTDLGLLSKEDDSVYFIRTHLSARIEDDHIPFIQKGVPCLHVIPSPFPDVWHRLEDNHSALDMDTIDNLNKIFRVFTLEYLQGSSRSSRSEPVIYEDL